VSGWIVRGVIIASCCPEDIHRLPLIRRKEMQNRILGKSRTSNNRKQGRNHTDNFNER
jgi:hypothetical protein